MAHESQNPPAPGHSGPSPADIMAALMAINKKFDAVESAVETLSRRVESIASAQPVPEPQPPPESSPDDPVTLKNRKPVPYEFVYDGRRRTVAALGSLILPRYLAEHARKHSAFALDIESEACDYAVGIEGEHEISPLSEETLEQYRNELLAFPPGYMPRGVVQRTPTRDEVLDRHPASSNRAGVSAVVGASA